MLLVACSHERPSTGGGETEMRQAMHDEAAQGYDAGVIPADLEYIPDGYEEPAEQAGALEMLTYSTFDSFNYGQAGHELTKTAWVYVPYGYDPTLQYDVFYLSHGGWGDETTLMGTDAKPTAFKHVIDHAIQDGRIRPVIMVMPTYNNLSRDDAGDYALALQLTDNFHNELVNDLLPAVESKYSTYAAGATPAALQASRDHRGFGGFSMGSVNTWHTFQYCLPYFRYFNAMSGGGLDGGMAARIAQEQGFGSRDFFVFTASGTADFAYSGFRSGVLAMPESSVGFFELADSQDAGNLSYREREGYEHGYIAANEYTYNAMRFFFNGTFGVDGGQGVGGSHDADSAASAMFELYTVSSPVDDVRNDPAFDGYGRLIFPVDYNIPARTTLADTGDYLIWYNCVRPERTVEICNYLKGRALAGDVVFVDIYTDEEKAADPWKADTGLFFFRGEPGARTAIVNAGGGFSYVGAMHDSFPHALELSKRGYNAFALIYRPSVQTACEDLARAIAYLHEHAGELGISMEGYSLWGGSAGARMAAWLGSRGTEAFGEAAYPRPAACIVNYTGLSEVTGDEPPTYSAVGTADGIASYRTMQDRIERIRENGTPAEIEVFEGLPHGFGLGEGTIAEGWFDHAVKFWEDNMV
ncbi:MAG: hypothetical protein IJ111_11635 [Eggerthellaceae bacterium]|nr:hypothetical protein [Eggerthellaceae bacterium]